MLDATSRILHDEGPGALTVGHIADTAGVGRQTIYRWWPGRAAIVLETATDLATREVPMPDTGTVDGDLRAFVTDTFTAAGGRARPLLRGMVAAALEDTDVAAGLARFTARRRAVLADMLQRHDVVDVADAAPLAELVYGTLWYRVLITDGPLDADAADALTDLLLRIVDPQHGG